MSAVALTIAGSDPSGGAGLQADLKTFHEHRVYGMAVVTLLTVQNTQLVEAVEVVNPELVSSQLKAVLIDIPPAAIKTGALGSASVISIVASVLKEFQNKHDIPIVVDPVMVSKHGMRLLNPHAESVLIEELLPRAFLITPNIPEAEMMTGLKIGTTKQMQDAGEKILRMGVQSVLLKGGHQDAGAEVTDVLVTKAGTRIFSSSRVQTNSTHGTGCVLSAAITALLAKGQSLEAAVTGAREFVHRALQSAPKLGLGIGPTNLIQD